MFAVESSINGQQLDLDQIQDCRGNLFGAGTVDQFVAVQCED